MAELCSSFCDDDRLTRSTPSMRRRLEMTLATSAWLVVQPTISIAGFCSDARSGSLLPPST